MKRLAILALFSFLLTASVVWSEEQRSGAGAPVPDKVNTLPASSVNLGKVGDVLVIFLVLSVLFEAALTPLFNWRVFLGHLDGKGWKTPITIGLAFLVFRSYDLDIVRDLLIAYGREGVSSTTGGQILTALLIAGGSSGVLELFRSLNIREPVQQRRERVERMKKELAQKTPSKQP